MHPHVGDAVVRSCWRAVNPARPHSAWWSIPHPGVTARDRLDRWNLLDSVRAMAREMGTMLANRSTLHPIPPGWTTPLEEWEVSLRASGLREESVDTRVRHMRRVARDLNVEVPRAVSTEDLVSWAGRQTWAAETRHSYYSSVRAFFRWASARTGSPDPASELPSIRRLPAPPRPTPEEVVARAVSEASPRTALILRLAAELGLRRSEVAAVHSNDLVTSVDGPTLTVRGKGGRTRVVPVSESLAQAIREQGRSSGGEFVFPGCADGHLSPRWVGKLAGDALPPGWTMHTLRHRFATAAYAGGGRDILAVQHLLGHGSVATTQRYTAVPEGALRMAVTAASAFRFGSDRVQEGS